MSKKVCEVRLLADGKYVTRWYGPCGGAAGEYFSESLDEALEVTVAPVELEFRNEKTKKSWEETWQESIEGSTPVVA